MNARKHHLHAHVLTLRTRLRLSGSTSAWRLIRLEMEDCVFGVFLISAAPFLPCGTANGIADSWGVLLTLGEILMVQTITLVMVWTIF